MDVKQVVVEISEEMNAREAAKILRATRQIFLPTHKPDDGFPYDIGSHFSQGEGSITYKPLFDGGMMLIFTPFDAKERIISLEERAKRLELFCATPREGFGQLANVVSTDILHDAARALGPINESGRSK